MEVCMAFTLGLLLGIMMTLVFVNSGDVNDDD